MTFTAAIETLHIRIHGITTVWDGTELVQLHHLALPLLGQSCRFSFGGPSLSLALCFCALSGFLSRCSD